MAGAVIAGIIIADSAPDMELLFYGGLALTSVFALVRRSSAAVYLSVALGTFLLHSLQTTDTAGLRLARQLGEQPRSVRAHGFVVSEPKFSPNGFCTFLLQLRSIQIEAAQSTRATLFVRWKGAAAYGDELDLLGLTEPIEPPRNPGEFDMRAYLARRDVRRQLFVGFEGDGRILRHRGGDFIMHAAQKSRRWLQQVLTRGLDDAPDVQALINGMALGLRHQTIEDIEEPFQETGTLHLFAVAGLHVGILAQLLWIICTVIRLPRRWAMALIVPALFFYAAVTGLHTSSVRAALMSAVLVCGFLIERRVFALNSLAAAATLILFCDTNQLFFVGFQLSFAVVAVIILLADPVFHWLARRLAQDPFLPRTLFSRPRRFADGGLQWLARGASVSLAAWAGSLPFILWSYNLVTPVSLLANLFVVPLAFFILAGALLSLLAAPLSSAVSIIFNNANWVLAKLLLGIVQLFAEFPLGHFYTERLPQVVAPVAEVTVLDVGRGAAVHLRRHGCDWLFDAGSERDFDRLLQPYLHSRGVNRLDGLLLTHGDAAHIGGAAGLVRIFRPRMIIDYDARDRSRTHRSLVAELGSAHLLRTLAAADTDVILAQDIKARILFPPRGFATKTADDQALVVQLMMRGRPAVLFVSDSGESTEQILLATQGPGLATPILVKGQHWSGISGSAAFLDAVRPKIIVATSRDFPNNEHIADDWAAMVRKRGIKLFRQDETGAVTLRFYRDHWDAKSYLTSETFRSSNR